MSNRDSNPPFSLTLFIVFFSLSLPVYSSSAKSLKYDEEDFSGTGSGYLVRRDQRRALVQTEYGDISSIDVTDGRRGPYHVQFITMEPNSLFLPVLLHADMVFYVHTGRVFNAMQFEYIHSSTILFWHEVLRFLFTMQMLNHIVEYHCSEV